jgi:hypothetical protein
LRQVRRACVEWLQANHGKRRWERNRIDRLWKAVHARVTVVIETVFDKTRSPTVRLYNETESFNRLTDGILSENAPKIHNVFSTGAGMSVKKGVAVKTVGANYDIERFTARHIAGHPAEVVKLKWEAAKTKLSLPDWIEQVVIPQSEEDRIGALYKNETSYDAKLMEAGVTYCSPQQRRDFLIEAWEDGIFSNANFEPFHTGLMKSVAGDGWAIFVVDLAKRLYAGPYTYGQFHHSSFLAGAPVLSAGEIAVDQGRVVGLTNNTGHYNSGPYQLKCMLELLQANGVLLHDVAVSDPLNTRDKWFRGTEALAAAGDLAKLGAGTMPEPSVMP